MTTEFTALNLRPELEQAVLERGYAAPTPIQAGMIPLMLTGQDVIGQAQTGTGKTAAFALPILQNLEPGGRLPQALVMAPTRELALQVAEAVYEYGKFCNVRVLAVYGGQPYARQITRLKKGVDVVVGTPGRLLDLLNQKALDLGQVRTVVLDEADEMLSMGFIEDIEAILSRTPVERQTALFSATLPREIRKLAAQYMREPQSIAIQREQMTVEAIEQRYYLVHETDKAAALTRLFEVEPITSALIFVRTRAGTGDLANELNLRGFPAEALSGELEQSARERVLNRFREGQIKVLVATDVAARGLDIDNISHVFNFDLPDDAEVYVHRIGRTGRAGKTGIAISLVAPYEKRRLREIEHFTRRPVARFILPSVEEIQARRDAELLEKLMEGVRHGHARRERILVNQLAAEGYDPLELAAVAIRLVRAEEQRRPIAAVSEVREQKEMRAFRPEKAFKRPARPGGERKFEKTSHERGMVRLALSRGRMHGVRPNDVVSTIAYHAEIPGHTIGKILIEDRQTLVDVPEQYAAQVLSKAGQYSIHRQPVTVERAG
jgi:ATP-dependent RNA helicase DeaD